MKKFEHGGNVYSFARKHGCSPEEVTDLSSSINFLSPNVSVDINSLNLQAYPDYSRLNKQISEFISLPETNFEIFNGATSAVFSLFRLISPDITAIYAPAYLEYFKAAEVTGSRTLPVNRLEEPVQELPDNANMAVLVNPSTPDGKYYDPELFLTECSEKNITPVIDESFIEFTGFPSATRFFEQFPELIIIKSFTKIFGFAAARLGIIISSEKNISQLKQSEPLWKISAFDSELMIQCMSDKSFISHSLNENRENKSLLIRIMNSFKHTDKIFHSDANYLLVKLKNISAEQFSKILEPHKIIVRNCSNFHFLNSSYVRISVKNSDAMLKLKRALDYA
jgi:threonine-phosphate decarboxylase